MKLYIHKGQGHYLGSVVIVLARSENEAHEMIRTEMDEMGLKGYKVDIQEVYETDYVRTIYTDSGDY